MKTLLTAIGAAVLALAAPAYAVNVVHQTAQGSYTTNVFGGSAWTGFTTMFDATHTRTAIADFSNPAALAGFDAAWVDQELGNALTGAEIANLGAYIGSGHKAVLIGENNSWAAWNASVMSVVGGSHTDACDWSVGGPLMGGTLTSGIASVQNICGSMVGAAGGAQVLFSNNMAALYAVGSGQALVILDSNWNDDSYWLNEDNKQFASNVVAWLATPVPEPSTWLLMALGLGAVGTFARKR
jgi:hypothetical protein